MFVGKVGRAGPAATLGEIRERLLGSHELLWWTFRFLDAVLGDINGAITEDDKSVAVECFLTLAVRDPAWAIAKVDSQGPEGHALATLLSEGRLTSALSRIRLASVKDDAMLRARMLSRSAHWERIKSTGDETLWHQAWQELLRVPEPERDEEWKSAALEPSSFVDYTHFRLLATERLAKIRDFDRSMFLPDAIASAARHRDWPTFETWVAAYRALPEPLQRGHSRCEVINLEGLRALEAGHLQAAEASMQELLESAAGETFLSNGGVSALPNRLRSQGLYPDLCSAFDELVKKRDWRRLKNL